MTGKLITAGIFVALAANAALSAPPKTGTAEQLPLFTKAVRADKERYNFAAGKGAEFLPTPDGRSFYILWLPPDVSPQKPPPVVFTLHGHGSWAFDEFFLWHKHIAEAGMGIVALQWWFGEGETPKDYYLPGQIAQIMNGIMRAHNIRKHSVLAHGFSRGSANIYGLASLDNRSEKFILLTVANAGKPGADFPINRDIASGLFGQRPLEGTYWMTYAGARDPHPERDGIPGMREAQEWIKRYGGAVKLAVEDENGDHGGFHRNPANVKKALGLFRQLLADQAKR